MLLDPSPRKVSLRPGERAVVRHGRSAGRRGPGRGGTASVSPLITGTAEAAARASRRSCLEGPPGDGRDLTGQDAGRVLDRLAPAEVGGLGVDDQRVTAELGDADRERRPWSAATACRTAPRRPAGRPAAGTRADPFLMNSKAYFPAVFVRPEPCAPFRCGI